MSIRLDCFSSNFPGDFLNVLALHQFEAIVLVYTVTDTDLIGHLLDVNTAVAVGRSR